MYTPRRIGYFRSVASTPWRPPLAWTRTQSTGARVGTTAARAPAGRRSPASLWRAGPGATPTR